MLSLVRTDPIIDPSFTKMMFLVRDLFYLCYFAGVINLFWFNTFLEERNHFISATSAFSSSTLSARYWNLCSSTFIRSSNSLMLAMMEARRLSISKSVSALLGSLPASASTSPTLFICPRFVFLVASYCCIRNLGMVHRYSTVLAPRFCCTFRIVSFAELFTRPLCSNASWFYWRPFE